MRGFTKNQTDFERAHPITIFFNLGRVFYLIIIPVLRGFVSALNGGLARWLSGAWADILVFLLMLLIAATFWFCLRFRCKDNHIEVRSGVINRRDVFIFWDNVTTLTVVEPFYLRPIHALHLRADTLGGSFKDADFSILLTPKQADKVLKIHADFNASKSLACEFKSADMSSNVALQDVPENLNPRESHTSGLFKAANVSSNSALQDISALQEGSASPSLYRPTTKSVVALSLLTSNSFGGILFMSTFISQSGKLLGSEFSQMIIGTFEEASRNLAIGIPPAAVALAYALIAGWFISFLLTFVRYHGFSLTRENNVLSISGGVFTSRKYYIKYNDVNFIDMRQSILTKLLRLNSLYISAVGYGKQKDDISCIVPTEQEAEFEENCKKIFPHMLPLPRTYTPKPRGMMRFLTPPATAIAAITAAMTAFLLMFPAWSPFIRFVGFMTYVPALFFLFIRIVDFKTCGLSFEQGNYTIRYSSGLTLHTVVVPADKVVCVELRQGTFQKFGKYCDLILSVKAEGKSLHRCRNLVKSELIELFQI